MEDFSQSRGDDDLFSDEITPLQVSQRDPLAEQTKQLSLQSSEPPTTKDESSSSSIQNPAADRSHVRGRGRGRPRARANVSTRSSGGLHESRFAPKPNQKQPAALEEPAQSYNKQQPTTVTGTSSQDSSGGAILHSEASATDQSHEDSTTSIAASQDQALPTGPSQQTTKTPAVRGDRTATGGLRKPKLTEEELTAKLAAAKERSKNLAEKHAKAQADAADFEERERIAQQKRQEEVIERRKLEGERERNRARKLQALGGREWDAEKNENDFKQPRYGESIRRGPAEDQQDLSIYEWRDEPDGHDGHGYSRGRGRGRGRARNRGRGFDPRGGRGNTNVLGQVDKPATSKPPAPEDFPALPGSRITGGVEEKDSRPSVQQRKDSDMAPAGSWADQMAS